MRAIGRWRGDLHMVRNLLFVLLCASCADSKTQEQVDHSASAAEDSSLDTGAWGDAGAEDSAPNASADAWTMSGELQVQDGLLLSERSLVVAEVQDALGTVLCHQTAGLASSTRAGSLPDGDIEAWWAAELEMRDTSTCGAAGIQGPLPDALQLGLGPLHPEVEAVLGSEAGDEPPEDVDVKSVFVSLGEGGDIWVFGLATMKPEPGVDTAGAEAGPFDVPDGIWRFRAVYPFRY